MVALGRELHEARTRAGLSRFEVATDLDVTISTLQSYEVGRRWIPIPRLLDLCVILDAAPGMILRNAKVRSEWLEPG